MPRSKTAQQHMRVEIHMAGSTAVVDVPFDPNIVWGEKERHYVTGMVGGCKIRGVLGVDGNGFVLRLGPAWVRDNKPMIGTPVPASLEPEGPLIEELATDVAAAIGGDAEAKRFFESVAPFYRKNAIRWIESAKRPETRAARIVEVVRKLRAGETM